MSDRPRKPPRLSEQGRAERESRRTRLAEAWGYPALYGLVLGLVAATALSSIVFHAWMIAALRAIDPRRGCERLRDVGSSAP